MEGHSGFRGIVRTVAREGFKTGKRKSLFQLEAKPATQYNPERQIIKTYKMAKEASESTGVPSGYINDAAKRKDRMAGGYYWRYGAALPVIKIQKQKKQRNITENTGPSRPPYLNRNLQNLPEEIWKSIDQFEGLYEISSCGRIKSLREGC